MNENASEEEVYRLMKISPGLANYYFNFPLIGILFTLDNNYEFIVGTEISTVFPGFSIFLPSDINNNLSGFIVKETIDYISLL